MALPRGLAAGTIVAMALTWSVYLLDPGRDVATAGVQSGVYLTLFVLAWRTPRLKILIVRTFQRWTINPLMRLLLTIGINPLGVAILETRGRTSGALRRVPVGNGRQGNDFWIIAEHGLRANYVRNIQHDSRVRIRLRIGLRYRWVSGIATVLPDDDALARQRRIIAWHPLRALNAMNVRVLGADLVTVHVRLDWPGVSPAGRRNWSWADEASSSNREFHRGRPVKLPRALDIPRAPGDPRPATREPPATR
jgi:deazaflavin-dependent oxidoreductase (nitroreductase family)